MNLPIRITGGKAFATRTMDNKPKCTMVYSPSEGFNRIVSFDTGAPRFNGRNRLQREQQSLKLYAHVL